MSKIVGMGFDGASTNLREENWGPGKHQKVSTTCFICALPLLLAAVGLCGIKYVYVTLTAHWKFFHYSPKRVESQNGLKGASSSRVEDCQSFRYALAGI